MIPVEVLAHIEDFHSSLPQQMPVVACLVVVDSPEALHVVDHNVAEVALWRLGILDDLEEGFPGGRAGAAYGVVHVPIREVQCLFPAVGLYRLLLIGDGLLLPVRGSAHVSHGLPTVPGGSFGHDAPPSCSVCCPPIGAHRRGNIKGYMPKEEHPNRHNSADFGEWEQISPEVWNRDVGSAADSGEALRHAGHCRKLHFSETADGATGTASDCAAPELTDLPRKGRISAGTMDDQGC